MKHLLFLEDEAFQIHLIEAYWKRCPLSTITTAEFFQVPSEAINRVALGGVDYFIMDMHLGNVSGYDVATNIWRQPCKPKIWAYTAFEKEPSEPRIRYFDEYISKTRGPSHLFAKLEASVLKDEPIICDLVLSA